MPRNIVTPNYSRPFDVHNVSEYKEVQLALIYLFKEIMQVKDIKRIQNKKRFFQSIRAIVLDLYLAYQEDPMKYVAISKSKSSYNKIKQTRYSKIYLSYTNTVNVICYLKILGYISERIGTLNRETGVGRHTRLQATPKLIKLIKDKGVVPLMVERDPRQEVIVLKDSNKKLIEYEDTQQIAQWRHNVMVINEAYAETNIDLKVTAREQRKIVLRARKDAVTSEKGADYWVSLDLHRKFVFRPFNNGVFTDGGRFYGPWWQSIPSQYRKNITIMGKDTVEVDYSAIHPRILYAAISQPISKYEDPYQIKGWRSKKARKTHKLAFNMMLNSTASGSLSGREVAKRVIAKEVITTAELPPQYATLDNLMDAIEERHPAIRHFFYKGYGVKLQYADSVVAEQVVLRMLQEGYVVLPVHDSFIVQQSREGLLRDVMEEVMVNVIEASSSLKSESKELEINPEVAASDTEHNVNEALVIKAETENNNSLYKDYYIRQHQWHEVKGDAGRPQLEGVDLTHYPKLKIEFDETVEVVVVEHVI